jgi:hypothetical protein
MISLLLIALTVLESLLNPILTTFTITGCGLLTHSCSATVTLPTVEAIRDVLMLLGIILEFPKAKDGNESSPGSVGAS